jgi:hypothetical protein
MVNRSRVSASTFLLCLVYSGAVLAQAPAPQPLRAVAVAEADTETDTTSLIFGENLRASVEFMGRHTRQANGGQFGDNALIADFLYDGAHRRVITRSLQLGEVDDPVDVRLGRAPGRYPNVVDFTRKLPPWTLVGQVGAVGWNTGGFSAYTTGIQFHVLGDSGILCLSTAPMTPTGSRYSGESTGEHLLCRVAVFPDGSIVLGFNSDPDKPPPVYVQGDLLVSGTISTFRGDALPYVVRSPDDERELRGRIRLPVPESATAPGHNR